MANGFVGRERKYGTNAERQKAHREKREAMARIAQEAFAEYERALDDNRRSSINLLPYRADSIMQKLHREMRALDAPAAPTGGGNN